MSHFLDSKDKGISIDIPVNDGHEARKALINAEANMRLEMDFYLRENWHAATDRWRLYRAISELESAVFDRYQFTPWEASAFEQDVQDLLDAGIDIFGNKGQQQTARIILRVMYQDNWKLFIDHMLVKLFTK